MKTALNISGIFLGATILVSVCIPLGVFLIRFFGQLLGL